MISPLPRDQLIEFCRKMLLIRYFEEALITLHNEGRFRGHYHVYIGQEATGVPALSLLAAEDYVFTTHRNHGHILARGADPGRMLAEILGRRDGYNKGKGGSFHVAPVELGFLQTSAVVAGILPLATGAAYAAKEKQSGQVSVCVFGDGALEEGAVAESFNLASIWKLPVLYLCENNGKYGHGKATGAMHSSAMSVFPLTDLPTAYKIPARQVEGTNVEAVIDVVGDALKKIRQGEGPQFIEAQTVRWPGSVSNWPVIQIATEVSLAWDLSSVPTAVKKSLESDYPRPKAGALRPIHGFATAISNTRPTHAFIPVHRTGHPAYSREGLVSIQRSVVNSYPQVFGRRPCEQGSGRAVGKKRQRKDCRGDSVCLCLAGA